MCMENIKRVTQDQAAFILNVSRQTIYNMQKRNELPHAITDVVIEKYVSDKRIELDRIEARHNFVKEMA